MTYLAYTVMGTTYEVEDAVVEDLGAHSQVVFIPAQVVHAATPTTEERRAKAKVRTQHIVALEEVLET